MDIPGTQVWALDALGALAHETRLSVFRMLVQAGPEGVIAGAISGRALYDGAIDLGDALAALRG